MKGLSLNSKYLISACLLGFNTRYDGKNKYTPEVLKFIQNAIPFCFEQLSGLPTPREPVCFFGGDGIDFLKGKAKVKGIYSGRDFSEYFKRGIAEFEKFFKLFKIEKIILKEKSPSCGVNMVYIERKLERGCGIVVSFLKINNIKTDIIVF